MQADKKADLVALASVPLIMTLGNSMLIPVLPLIEKTINISSFQSSMLITIYSIVSIILIPLAGYLSDQFGRKAIIIPGLVIVAIGGLVSGLASWKMEEPYVMILLGRLIQGIGASGAFPVVIPTIGDMFDSEADISQGLGIIETSNTFGKVLSPILGASFAAWIWFVPFFAIPVFSLIAIVMVMLMVQVPKNKEENKQKFADFIQQIKDILQQKGRWLYAIFALGWVSMFVYFGILFYFTSVLEKDYHIEALQRGFIIAIPLLTLCLTSYLVGRNIGQEKKLMKWITFSGSAIITGSLIGAGFVGSLVMLVVTLSIAGIGIGAVLPSLDAMITEGIEQEHRGTITSLYSSMRLLGVALGPPFSAFLMKSFANNIVFFVLAGVGAAAAVIAFVAIKPSENQSS